MNKFKVSALFTLITLTLVACGVQDKSDHGDVVNPPPSCGVECQPVEDAGSPVADSGTPTDAGQPSSDAGEPADSGTTDSGNTEPEPLVNAGKCESAADCDDGMECHDGLCVPVGIIPEPAPVPECTEDADCSDDDWCSNGQCVADGTDPDTAPPAITDITVTNITATTVMVSWTSSESSTDNHVAYYRFDTDEVQLGFAVDDSTGKVHSFTVTHLSPSTTYNFYVSSTDAAGNVGESDFAQFTTAALPPGNLPAPFRDHGGGQIEFSKFYTAGSGCAEVRGTLPGMSWTDGPYITDGNGDGYMEYSPTAGIPYGEYSLSYVDRECAGQTSQNGTSDWANFGALEMVKLMRAEDRAYLYCNWYDSTAGHTVTAPDTSGDGKPDPGCEIRIMQDANGLHPNGNMANAQL